MANDQIVSIGFLTRGDLERLGATFTRHFPIEEEGPFAELLAKLDAIEAVPRSDRGRDQLP